MHALKYWKKNRNNESLKRKIRLKIIAQKTGQMGTKDMLQGEKATGSDHHRFAGHPVSVPPYADGRCTELGFKKG